MVATHRLLAFVALVVGVFCVSCSSPHDSQLRYSVVVVAFDPEWKIRSIKAIREQTGLGLADAKHLIEAIPSVVRAGLTQSEAEAVASQLRAQQMTVELRKDP